MGYIKPPFLIPQNTRERLIQPEMSHAAQNASLSLSARLLCYLGPPSAILLTSIASPRTAVLLPFAFIPTAYFFRIWRASNNFNSSRRGELEPMIWTYAAAGTVGLTTVALVQMVTGFAVGTMLFGAGEMRNDFWKELQRSTIAGLTADELARRAALAVSWQNWVFNSAMTFFLAGLVEETLKYLPIAYARRRGTAEQRQRRNRAYIDYALAGALGFSVVESIGFLYASCEQGRETGSRLIITLFERLVVCSLGHLLVASLTALRATRRDFYGDRMSWWVVVGPSVILHGAFDFVAMAASALEGNVGWIHPIDVRNTAAMSVLISGVLATAAWQVRREWKVLDDRD